MQVVERRVDLDRREPGGVTLEVRAIWRKLRSNRFWKRPAGGANAIHGAYGCKSRTSSRSSGRRRHVHLGTNAGSGRRGSRLATRSFATARISWHSVGRAEPRSVTEVAVAARTWLSTRAYVAVAHRILPSAAASCSRSATVTGWPTAVFGAAGRCRTRPRYRSRVDPHSYVISPEAPRRRAEAARSCTRRRTGERGAHRRHRLLGDVHSLRSAEQHQEAAVR